MLYDRAAMRAAVGRIGLSVRSQKFVESWLAAWQGGHLPAIGSVTPERFQNLKPLLMVSSLTQDAVPVARILFSGDRVTRFLGHDLTGRDWFSLVEPEHLPERTGRTASVAGGALLKTVREVKVKSGGTLGFEMISAPLRPDADGTVCIFNYLDLPSSAKNAVLAELREVTIPPVRAEFVPIPLAEAPRAAPGAALQGWMTSDNRRKVISQASVRFVISFMREAMKTYAPLSLDPTDYLIILTIDTQNVAHVHNDPKISMRYAALAEPDWIRRGVSRAEVSRITQIPLETVRRRINRLIEMDVLADRKDGVIVPESTRMAPASRRRKMHINTQLVERLISDLDARGVPLS
jgi:hypothetical protein